MQQNFPLQLWLSFANQEPTLAHCNFEGLFLPCRRQPCAERCPVKSLLRRHDMLWPSRPLSISGLHEGNLQTHSPGHPGQKAAVSTDAWTAHVTSRWCPGKPEKDDGENVWPGLICLQDALRGDCFEDHWGLDSWCPPTLWESQSTEGSEETWLWSCLVSGWSESGSRISICVGNHSSTQ